MVGERQAVTDKKSRNNVGCYVGDSTPSAVQFDERLGFACYVTLRHDDCAIKDTEMDQM